MVLNTKFNKYDADPEVEKETADYVNFIADEGRAIGARTHTTEERVKQSETA